MSQTSFTRPTGWNAGRTRRARGFALVAVVAVALGLFTLTMPWYSFNLTSSLGSPGSVTLTTEDYTQVSGISAAGSITGMQTVQQTAMLAAASETYGSLNNFGPKMSTAPVPPAQFGIPATAFFLMLGGLLVAAAALLRNGFPALVGLFVLVMSWQAFGALQEAMTWGVGGALNTPGPGLPLFGYALTFTIAAGAVGGSWIGWINHTERVERKRQAKADGVELPPSFLDSIAGGLVREVTRRAEVANAASKKEGAKVGA